MIPITSAVYKPKIAPSNGFASNFMFEVLKKSVIFFTFSEVGMRLFVTDTSP